VFGNQWVKEKFLVHQTLNQCGVVLSSSEEELVSKGWVMSTLDWQLSQKQRTTFDLKPLFSQNQRTCQITNHLKPSIFANSFIKPTYSLNKKFKIPELVVISP
jgi:hypothetical protein